MGTTEEIGDILYDYGRGLYANITNRCPCRCEFCIRNMTGGLGTADSLWLKREPTYEEIVEEIRSWELAPYDEFVFCGYGEPTERLEDMLRVADYIHENTHLSVRLNTNGLSDLINGKDTAPLMEGRIDSISISLNQCTEDKYYELCHPSFGKEAYGAMLKFTEEVKKFVPQVAMSVVGVIPMADIAACEKIAEDLDVPFRVR